MTVWGAIPVKKTISSRGGCELALQPQAQGVMGACLIPINSNCFFLHPQPAASPGWAEMPVVLWEQGKVPGWGSCPALCRPCHRSISLTQPCPAGQGTEHRIPQGTSVPGYFLVSPGGASCGRDCMGWSSSTALLQPRAWVIPGGTDLWAMKSVCSSWELS